MEALEMVCQRFGGGKRQTDGSFMCKCPAHEDRAASLHLTEGKDGRVLVKCHAGCETETVVRAIGLELRDLFPRKDGASIVAVYDYVDAAGTMRFQTVRFAPKDFRQRRPDSKGGWAWNLKGVLLVLYRLPSVIEAAKAGRTVLVTEGEKDADNLAVMGFVATTSPMGAGKWRDSYSESLAGAPVVIIADKDESGRKHAEQVAKSVFSMAKSVRIIELPGDGIKDASDWIRAGGTKEQLQAIAKAAPVWTPGESVVSIKAAKEAREEQASIEVEPEPVNDWPAPLSFGSLQAPPLSTGLLPDPIASFVSALAESTQTPLEACMVAALGTVAAAMAKKAIVVYGPDWSEPLNLYVAMVMAPAERKSAILNGCKAPLEEWQVEQAAAYEERHASLSAEKRILENRARAAEKRASGKNADAAAKDEAIRMAREAAAFRVQALPQPLVDDITTEKIVGVMQEQGGKVALFSEEGGIFDIMAGLYASGGIKIDAYLKAHDGGNIRVDRIGRASDFVSKPALTMCLGIQPDVIRSLSDKPAFRGRGLLGRVLYVLPESMLGRRKIETEPIPDEVRASYHRCIRALLNLPSGWQDPGRKLEPFRILLSPEARARFIAFRSELEPQLAKDADLGAITDWAGKLPGAVLRIAGLLHSVEAIQAGGAPWDFSISEATMGDAIGLGRFFEQHAQAAFGMMAANATQRGATTILEWVARKALTRFTKREAYRALARHFESADGIEAPIRLLLDRGYLRQASVNGVNGVSTRALTAYEPHPSVFADYCQRKSTPLDTVNNKNNEKGHTFLVTPPNPPKSVDTRPSSENSSASSALTNALTAVDRPLTDEPRNFGVDEEPSNHAPWSDFEAVDTSDFDVDDDSGADREAWQ